LENNNEKEAAKQNQQKLKQVCRSEVSKRFVTLMHKESVQQQVLDDSKLQQPETRLDEEIDKLWMLWRG